MLTSFIHTFGMKKKKDSSSIPLTPGEGSFNVGVWGRSLKGNVLHFMNVSLQRGEKEKNDSGTESLVSIVM